MAESPSSVVNPFRDSIHANPWIDPRFDVPEIGQQAFAALRTEVEAVRRLHSSRSLLIFGAPGCGKTHLIARARMFLADLTSTQWLNNVFIAVQMHTAPSRIWRHIRFRLVEDLLRVPPSGRSQMDSLLFRLLAAPGSRGPYLDAWKQDLHDQADEHPSQPLAAGLFAIVSYLDRSGDLQELDGEMIQRLDGEESIPAALRSALLHLAYRRHLGNVYAWLRGESLSEGVIETLGVGRPDDEDPEGESRDFVLSMLRIIGAGTPVVFCFDQVEALQSVPGDVAGFYAFGHAVSALHDLAANAVLISFVQSIFVDSFKGAMGSHFDRISEKVAELPGLTPAQAGRLIGARTAGLTTAQASRMRLGDFADLFERNGLAPSRQIIARAAQLFDQKGDGTLDEFIASRWETFLENAERTAGPAKADEILEHGLPLLLRLNGQQAKFGEGSRDVQITFSSPAGVRGISICNQENMNSLAGRLRRLKSGMVPAAQLVLVRDARLPINQTAKKSMQLLGELTGNRTRFIRASPETMAALNALRLLITSAQAGDLAHNGNAVEPQTVEDWLAKRLPTLLNQLSSELTGDAAAADITLLESLIELLGTNFLLPLAEAAVALKSQPAPIAACAADNPSAIGYLAGPPALLFHRVADGGV